MSLPSVTRPAWTIGQSMWFAHRAGFVALLSGALGCGWLYHVLPTALVRGEAGDMLGYLPMGLSLFFTFVLCNFTETDARGRLDGFPSRLFVLPVSTATLVATPLAFSVLAVGVIYIVWATLALPALGRPLPVSWPVLYLATGMVCYQAMVWTLARFRIARLLSLGIGGTLFATGWLLWREEAERDFFYGLAQTGLPVRTLLCAILVAVSMSAFLLASMAVENQRRGGGNREGGWRTVVLELSLARRASFVLRRLQECWERFCPAWPGARGRFVSPARAQFWYEWRRHGSLLPVATGAVLFVIMAPTLFMRPIGAEPAGLILCWILALPLLLAWVLGKGFGKADLWSKAPALSLFHATRPLSNADWLAAKIKAATLATVTSWALVLLMTPLWLRLCCDWESLSHQWRMLLGREPRLLVASWSALLVLMLFTWRCLVGSLWIGLSGKTWLLNLAACGVFVGIFSPLIGAIPLVQDILREARSLPAWVPRALAGLLVARITAAVLLAVFAQHRGLLTWRAIRCYAVVWLGVAAALVTLVRQIIPFELLPTDSGWSPAVFGLLTLFFVPLLRVSYAPLAASRNRHR